MPVLKSETRIKEIDTTQPSTNASEYASGDIVYDQNSGLMRHNGSNFVGIEANFEGMFINTGIAEKLEDLSGPHETDEDYDCSISQVFYHTIPTSATPNWRVNLINFSIPPNSATNIVIIVNQDANYAAIPDELTISDDGNRSGGSSLTILWANGELPTPTLDGTDVFSFTIFKQSGITHYVMGQMVPFKQVS